MVKRIIMIATMAVIIMSCTIEGGKLVLYEVDAYAPGSVLISIDGGKTIEAFQAEIGNLIWQYERTVSPGVTVSLLAMFPLDIVTVRIYVDGTVFLQSSAGFGIGAYVEGIVE